MSTRSHKRATEAHAGTIEAPPTRRPSGLPIYCAPGDAIASQVAGAIGELGVVHGAGGDADGSGLSAAVLEPGRFLHLFSLEALTGTEPALEIAVAMGDVNVRTRYVAEAVPVFLARDGLGAIDLRGPTLRRAIFHHWLVKVEALESALPSEFPAPAGALAPVRRHREVLKHITRFLRIASTSSSFIASAPEPAALFERIAGHPRARHPRASRSSEKAAAGKATLLRAHDAIVVRSHADPEQPEFPPFSPSFPASPIRKISVPELRRSVLVKDESWHFTGSHKSRMAWEVVVFYRSLLEDCLAAGRHEVPFPSVISNGSAATAIQLALKCFGLPDLRVLLDQRTDPRVAEALRSLGCKVFVQDLSEQELDSGSILEATSNPGGIDLTDRRTVDPTFRNYYDWLSYEVFNSGARHIFVPVGTGDLFVNILGLLRDEALGLATDKRLSICRSELVGLEVYGATALEQNTAMTTLFAAHRPSLIPAEALASDLKSLSLCGERTGIYGVDERVVGRALTIAQQNSLRTNASGIAGLSLLLNSSAVLEIPPEEEILIVSTGWMPLAPQRNPQSLAESISRYE